MVRANKQWMVGLVALAEMCMGCGEGRGTTQGKILTVEPAYSVVEQGKTLQLEAMRTDEGGLIETITGAATWTSSDESVATVRGGVVTGVSSGTCEIEARLGDMTRTVTVTVEPTLERIEIAPHIVTTATHAQAVLRAVGIFADGSKHDVTDEATWISVDPNIASVAGPGRFTGVQPGEVQINAILGERSATPQVLTVDDATLDSLHIDAPSLVLPVGEAMQLGVTGRFDAGGVERAQDLGAQVTWELAGAGDDDPVAELSDSGVLTGLRPGTANVTARWTQGEIEKSASLTIEIREYELVAIAIQHRGEEAPDMLQLPLASEPTRLTVLGTYEAEDGERLTWDITQDAAWESEGNGAAFLFWGSLIPFKPGTVTLEAVVMVQSAEGETKHLTGEIVIEVVDAPLERIEITIHDQQAPAPGATRLPLKATGTFAGNGVVLTQDLTETVIWEVDEDDYVAIDNIGPEVGVAQIIARPEPGAEAATVTTHARYLGSEGTYTLSVPAPVVK